MTAPLYNVHQLLASIASACGVTAHSLKVQLPSQLTDGCVISISSNKDEPFATARLRLQNYILIDDKGQSSVGCEFSDIVTTPPPPK